MRLLGSRQGDLLPNQVQRAQQQLHWYALLKGRYASDQELVGFWNLVLLLPLLHKSGEGTGLRNEDEFRRRAALCLKLAGAMSEPGHRAALLDMAERWRELAQEVSQAAPPVLPAPSDTPPEGNSN